MRASVSSDGEMLRSVGTDTVILLSARDVLLLAVDSPPFPSMRGGDMWGERSAAQINVRFPPIVASE